MVFGYFTLFVALMISAVAEFYSIVGLTAIFSAAFWPVVIMGASLGIGKITAAVWLKMNWDRASFAYKLYLVPAVAFLMALTSMGIFGYLSKAHSDQSLVSGDSMAKVAIYDEKIKIEKDNIDANRKALKQLDEAVDQVMGRSTTETGAERAVQIRRGQQKERGRLLAEIGESQKRITTLNEERAPLAIEFRKVEAEVGPIKYIAALVYGDNPDANLLEKAVRLVIIMIVAVFDPLALVLILAAQQSLRWARDDTELEQFQKELDKKRAVAQALDKQEEIPGAVEVPMSEQPVDSNETIASKHPYLNRPFEHFKNLKPMVYKPERSAEQQLAQKEPVATTEFHEPFEEHDDPTIDPVVKAAMKAWKEANPNSTLKEQRQKFARGEIDRLPWLPEHKPEFGFGLRFPAKPQRGDRFVRIDKNPHQLFKFNGSEWILLDKTTTDNYTYDEAYIDHLIDQISTGTMDPELLNENERDLIAQRLTTKKTNEE